MGLSLVAVNKSYGYTKNGDYKKGNIRYSDVDIGYCSYKIFRDDLLKYLTNNRINKLEELDRYFGKYFYDDKTYRVATKQINNFSKEELQELEVIAYLKKLEKLKIDYPKLYDCFAFIEHCDCEGEMPYQQVEDVLPHLKDFAEKNKKQYGYLRALDFTNDLILVLEDVVKNKGKLYFS